MDVYLVQPPVGGTKIDVTPPLGVLLLAALAEREGHTAHVVDLNLQLKVGELDPTKAMRTTFVKSLPKRSGSIGLIGVTAWSYNFGITMEFVDAVKKKHPHVPLVLGGPHVSFVDVEVMQAFPQVDFVLRDECDRTFPQLLRALAGQEPGKLALIPGLTWRQGGEVVRNAPGSVVEDLDGLPYPAYHRVDPAAYLACQPTIVVEAGRGCPYNCNFCSTSNMFQRKYRVKSAARLVDEIVWTMQATGGRKFELLHDNLVANKKYVEELCWEIRRRNLDFAWSCTSRTDNLTEEVAEQLFLAGCESVFFGVETLSAERQQWTGKKLKPPKVEAAIAMTARQHLTPSLGIIVGFPDESREEFDATVGTALRWTTDPEVRAQVSTAALRYYPGADLFAHADQLRYDELASADVNVWSGYRLRPEWRHLTRLFPLDAIHTPPEETRRNLVRRSYIRTLLKAAPLTFRALVERAGLGPQELLDRMAAQGRLAFLEQPGQVTLWNETLSALAALVGELALEPLQDLLTCEVPFWRTRPAIEPINHLEHVIEPKRFEQASLQAWALGRGPAEPERVQGQSVLSVRCGLECVVWFTDRPEQLWAAFQQQFARDARGTIAYVNSLRRGL